MNGLKRIGADFQVGTEWLRIRPIFTTNLFIPFARTTHCGINSIKVMGPKIWNEIPNNIRSIKSKRGFLDSLKLYYLSIYG